MHMPAKPLARLRAALAATCLLGAFSVVGEEYLGRDEFLLMAFGDTPPVMGTLWLTEETKAGAKAAVGWAPAALRSRRMALTWGWPDWGWGVGGRVAWVRQHARWSGLGF